MAYRISLLLLAFSESLMRGCWLLLVIGLGCARREIPAEIPVASVHSDPLEGARLASRRNDQKQALELWTGVLSRAPGNPEARVRKAVALLGVGKRAESASELETMLRERPDWIEALYARGMAAHQAGDTALANRMFGKALDNDPELASFLALIFLDTDTEATMRTDVSRYRQEFERLAEARPGHAEVREFLGLSYLVEAERTLRRADFERAGQEFSAAIRNRGGKEPFYYRANRGYIRLCLGDNAGADEDFQVARSKIDAPNQAEMLQEKTIQARKIHSQLR